MRKSLVFLCLTFAIWGCDNEPNSTGDAPAQKESGEVTGTIKIDTIKIRASQGTLVMNGSPKPNVVEKDLLEALYAQPNFDEQGALKAALSATYDIRKIESAQGTQFDVVLFGDVNVLGVDDPIRYKAEVRATNKGGETLDEVVKGTVKEFASKLEAQARVEKADEDTLIKLIKDSSKPAARRMAVQEARERRVQKAIPALREILKEPSPQVPGHSEVADLKVSAAAGLVAMGDAESYSKIVAFAEERSRMRDPQLIALVYIIGGMKTDESNTYLEALSTAHEAAPVREAALRALKSSGQMP